MILKGEVNKSYFALLYSVMQQQILSLTRGGMSEKMEWGIAYNVLVLLNKYTLNVLVL